MRVLRKKIPEGKPEITKLKEKKGKKLTNKDEIVDLDLCINNEQPNTDSNNPQVLNQCSYTMSEITREEILSCNSLSGIPGEDDIAIEVKEGVQGLLKTTVEPFKVSYGSLHPVSNNAVVVIMHMKGESTTDLKNYRPNSCLHTLVNYLPKS